MKFREIQNNTTWVVYNNIINHNMNCLGKLKIPLFLKRSYAKLISFYPFTENQVGIYLNLNLSKRIPFLLKHLVKVGRKNGFKKSLIDRLYQLKNDYDTKKKNKYSTVEYTDRMMMYLVSKDYDSILDLHLTNDKISTSYENFAEYTKLLINYIIDDEIVKIRNNHKVWNTNRMAMEEENLITRQTRPIYAPRYGRIEVTEERIEKKSKSFLDLNIKMDSLTKDVSEWDIFIEDEINKRIDKKINELSKLDKKKDQNKYYNDSPVDYQQGQGRGVREDREEVYIEPLPE